MSKDFYKSMNVVREFEKITDEGNYKSVPEDWWIFITDVVNSTQAIEKGMYKEVNTSGAISLVALANQKLHTIAPVIFGGDGITLLSPPDYLENIKDILSGTRSFVRENFDLILRVGFISIKELKEKGGEVLLGKYSSSNPFTQAVLAGNGLDIAEINIKSENSKYLLSEEYIPKNPPSFEGFACPFRDIKSDKGFVLSLILKSRKDLNSYKKILSELYQILGPEINFYPISWSNFKMGKTPEELNAWVVVAAGKKSGFKFRFLGLLFSIITRILSLSVEKRKKRGERRLPLFSDHKKFDGSLKMVINCDKPKRDQVVSWLEKNEASGEIYFGLHESDSALLTCVFNGAADYTEIHLIDGSNGGYALAAKSLKKKLKIN